MTNDYTVYTIHYTMYYTLYNVEIFLPNMTIHCIVILGKKISAQYTLKTLYSQSILNIMHDAVYIFKLFCRKFFTFICTIYCSMSRLLASEAFF